MKKKKDGRKKVLILSLLGLLSLMIITVGITYAIFTYTKLGTTDNTVTTGTLKFLYTENTGVKTGIKLTNALPISDTQGKALDGDNNVFDFSIEATNTGADAIPYEVTLRKKDTSTLKEDYVKAYLTDRTETTEKEELEPTNFNKLTQTNIDVGSEIEKTIYNGSVDGNITNYKKDFRLRMWIDETSNQTDINGKEFTAMVNVYSNAKVISETEQELRSNADIQSVIVGEDTLTKVENQDYDYTITIPNTSNPIINIIPVNSLSSVEITKDNTNIVNGTNINPVVGDNIYNVKVISADKSSTNEVKVRIKSQIPVSLKDEIMKNTIITASPTLTTSSNNTSDASGLYSSTATNTGEATYYFRGTVENNYVKFAGFTWRIVRINEDGTIRMIMQDGINNNALYEFGSTNGNYKYMYYTNSHIKTILESWYDENIASKSNLLNNVVTGNYYCEQAKVKYNASWTSGSATMTVYSSYTPNFKCATDGNNKGLVNSSIGLITYDEVIFAGGYYHQYNYDYYLYSDNGSWTMSPSGFYTSTATAWRIKDATINRRTISDTNAISPVIVIKSDALTVGEGTSIDPFVIS